MADHGFGKTKASKSIASACDLGPILADIRQLDYIIRAWELTHAAGAHEANIGFKFRPNHPSPKDMVTKIEQIIKNHDCKPSDTDIYIKKDEEYSPELEGE